MSNTATLTLSQSGRTLLNNSYLSFHDIGRSLSSTLKCQDDSLPVDWHYSNGEIVPQFSWADSSIRYISTLLYARKYARVSYLFREGVPPTLGQYYCNTSDQRIFITIGK